MANSITLSQSLVDDIAQKIQDGTATAEQVVLYTKGLQQLQQGNDFQAVVIGLSQSAVDAIDSSNAQFQEDSQAAIDAITSIFNTTASDIDTSADNAVAAINNAKDTLNSSSVNLETTISGLPSLTQIREGVYNDSNYIHPYDRPAYVMLTDHDSSANETSIYWMNHRGEWVCDKLSGQRWRQTIYFGDWKLDGTSGGRKTASNSTFNYREITAGYYTHLYTHTYPTTGSNGEANYYTSNGGTFGPHYGHFNDTDMRQLGLDNQWNNSWMRDVGVVVGDADKRYHISRTNDIFKIGGSKGIATSTIDSWHNRAWMREGNANSTSYGFPENYWDEPQRWKNSHETFQITGVGTGYGMVCYNKNTNKLLVMTSDGSYNHTPKVYGFASDFNLVDIAKGEQQIGYNYDVLGNLKLTLEIDGTVSNSTGRPSNSTAEANYRGISVLCDNGNVVEHIHTPATGGTAFTHRWTPNGAGDDLIYDTHFNHSGQTTNYGYEQGSSYGVRSCVSNDGKYVVAFNSYYYYGAGIRSTFIRVSDGKVLFFDYSDTSYGYKVIPVQRNKFYFGIQAYTGYSYNNMADMDYLFAQHADGTFLNLYQSNTTGYSHMWGEVYPSGFAQWNNIYKEYSPEIGFMNENDIDTRTL